MLVLLETCCFMLFCVILCCMEVYEVQYFSIMCMQENEFHPQPNTVFLGCFTADKNASHVVIIKKFIQCLCLKVGSMYLEQSFTLLNLSQKRYKTNIIAKKSERISQGSCNSLIKQLVEFIMSSKCKCLFKDIQKQLISTQINTIQHKTTRFD